MEKEIKNSVDKEESLNNEEPTENLEVEKDENVEDCSVDSKADSNYNLETDQTKEEIIEEGVDCEPEFQIRILENKLKEQEDAYMRINAEYANYRRRTSEEKSSIGLFANEKIMNELIPVIDNMERALSSFEDKENPLYKGVELVYKQMIEALNKNGLESISSEIGEDFDPNFHMAVLQEENSDFEAGKIVMVLQNGYKLGNKVLRAAMVKVSC